MVALINGGAVINFEYLFLQQLNYDDRYHYAMAFRGQTGSYHLSLTGIHLKY